jgi:ribose-phosphate pyrophosphokinase
MDHAVAQKTRRGDRLVECRFTDPNVFAGRPTLLVDDIVASGGTLIACAKALTTAGAASVDAIVTHALFSPELALEFSQNGIRSIRSTTSVPHPSNAIALDELLAAALLNELSGTQTRESTS